MTRQSGMVAEQIDSSDALRRDRVVESKLRQIVAHRLGPIEAPLVDQHREAKRREGLGDRAEDELRIHRDGQGRLHVTQSISLDPISLAVSRDSQRETGDLPFLHSFADEGVEIIGESVRHGSASSLLRDLAFGLERSAGPPQPSILFRRPDCADNSKKKNA
jgi:hypothetical protein